MTAVQKSGLVSILIPCLNAEFWIGQAIESALAQTYLATEVIVVDDGSTDGSLDVIKRFDRHIRWETGPNRGSNAARNRLLSLAQGPWLQYLDADDYLLPDKVERQMEFIAERPDAEVDLVYSPYFYDEFRKPDCATYDRYIFTIPEPHDLWILFIKGYLPQTGAPLWRKTAVEAVGGWNDDPACRVDEYELYLRLILGERRFLYCPHIGAVYQRWSDDTLSGRRNSHGVAQRRAEIIDFVEEWLRSCGELTHDRETAIYETRFKMATMAQEKSTRSSSGLIPAFPN